MTDRITAEQAERIADELAAGPELNDTAKQLLGDGAREPGP